MFRPALSILLLASYLLPLAADTAAQVPDCIDYANYLSWTGSLSLPDRGTSLALANNVAYITTADSLRVLDVSITSNPRLVASLMIPGGPYSMALESDRAYIGYNAGIQVVDISSPTKPRLRGRVSLPASPRFLAVTGSVVCTTWNDGLYEVFGVVDATDPDSPTAGSFIEFSIWTPPSALAAFGNHAYLGIHDAFEENRGSLHVFDVSDPYSIQEVIRLSTLLITGLTIEPNRSELAQLDYSSISQNCTALLTSRLIIYDLLDPAHPTTVATRTYNGWGPVGTPTFSGDGLNFLMRRAMANPPSPLYRLWIVDRPSLSLLQEVPTQSVILGQNADVTYGLGTGGFFSSFLAMDTTILAFAPIVSSLHLNSGNIYDVKLNERLAYITTGQGSCTVSIANPEAPQVLGCVYSCPYMHDLALAHPLVYATGYGGLCVIDATTPATPIVIGVAPARGNGVAVQSDHAYVADYTGNGLTVVDVSDPRLPEVVGAVDLPGEAWQVAVRGNIAYVADTTGGLQLVEISDPTVPVIIGALTTPGQALDVEVSWPYAYVADSSTGLVVIDVVDPVAPVIVAQTDGLALAERIVLSGSLAYLSSAQLGLVVIDISAPTNPRLIGGNPTISGVLAADSTGVYVASSKSYRVCRDDEWTQTGDVIIAAPGCQPIPGAVTLSFFDYDLDQGAVVLRWNAIRETDHLGYLVQRSRDAGSVYSYIRRDLIEGPGPYTLRDPDVVPGATYFYRLEAVARDGSTQLFGPLQVTLPPTPVPSLALEFEGENPASTDPVTFRFSLPGSAHVLLRVYDVRGRSIRTVVDSPYGPGDFHAAWDGRDERNKPVGAGVFFCRLNAGDDTVTRRLVRLPQ